MKKPEVVLVGQPNSGKSTIFNVLSDIKAASSNFSGTSVEKMESDINISARVFHIIDLPGVYSLNPGDDAEKVTFGYLTEKNVDLVINVVDAAQLARSLELTVELMEFGIPMVIALNMWDEAERKGLKIYPEKLEQLLNIPVVTTSALYGKGIKSLMKACYERVNKKENLPDKIEYTSHIEENVNKIENNFLNVDIKKNGSPRFYAIKAIENPKVVPSEILKPIKGDLETVRNNIIETHKKDCYETVSYERHHIAMKLTEEISHFIDRKTIPLRERVDRYLLHPFLGYFPLFSFFLIFFVVIYFTGNILSKLIGIPLGEIPGIYEGLNAHQPFLWFTVDGIYQGIEGALGICFALFPAVDFFNLCI